MASVRAQQTDRCLPTAFVPALASSPGTPPLGSLALVIATRPPPLNTDHRPTEQFCASLTANAPDFYRSLAGTMLFAADSVEAEGLSSLVSSHSWPVLPGVSRPHVSSFEAALRMVSPNSSLSDVHHFPEKIQCLSSVVLANVHDVARYGSIWRTIKRAYGASLALVDFRASHVMVADADGFVWKDLRADAVLAHSHTVWYSDHRGRAHPSDAKSAIERAPRVDTNSRARLFCSLHPYAGTLRAAAWDDGAARFAIGRSWAEWEAVVAQLELMPAPDADFADDPMLVLEASAFGSLWSRVGSHVAPSPPTHRRFRPSTRS